MPNIIVVKKATVIRFNHREVETKYGNSSVINIVAKEAIKLKGADAKYHQQYWELTIWGKYADILADKLVAEEWEERQLVVEGTKICFDGEFLIGVKETDKKDSSKIYTKNQSLQVYSCSVLDGSNTASNPFEGASEKKEPVAAGKVDVENDF